MCRINFEWKIGEPIGSPNAQEKLVVFKVPIGKEIYIHGFDFWTTDPNANRLVLDWRNKGTYYSKEIPFGGAGLIKDVETAVAWNEGFPADPQSDIRIILANAGALAHTCQASILIAEEVKQVVTH
jgi:hypothetical protein